MDRMSWFSRFGSRKPHGIDTVHPVLGQLAWDSESAEWVGTCEGCAFSLACEASPEPAPEMLRYAVAMLGDFAHLVECLEAEKDAWIKKYPLNREEIEPLAYEHIGFYRRKRRNGILASLGPDPSNGRIWRIEFSESTCIGLDFDS
jgi:hypothetical protein